jgi:hypothetical protein
LKRRLQAGIDYGTSASKVVIRDYGAPGGEACHVVLSGRSYRHSSAVAIEDGYVILGEHAHDLRAKAQRTVFESIKMRMLGHCLDGREERPTPDLDWQDLAIGSLWLLISKAERFATKLVGKDHLLGVTIGVPRAFMQSKRDRDVFLTAVRAAWEIFKREGPLSRPVVTIEQLASLTRATKQRLTEVAADHVGEWIRSEAEAAMWWAFSSPGVGIGPYAKIDIGAGTTNASVFRITGDFANQRWIKDGLAFFGAHSHPCGMDDVCRALAPEGASFFDLRGKEREQLQDRTARAACAPAFDGIARAFREAWRQLWMLNGGSVTEMQAWHDAAIAFIGGGSVLPPLTDYLAIHPQSREPLRALTLESPRDLRLNGAPPPLEALRFLLVAYGLAVIGLAIPEARGPNDIPPLEKPSIRAKRLEHEDIYGNG